MFKNKSVIVTGATRSIGRAIAVAMSREGAGLIISGNHEETLAETALMLRNLGAACEMVASDIALPQTAEALVNTAVTRFGTIDVVVNNAGINQRTPFLQLESRDWQHMLDVNLGGPFHLLRAALPLMARQRNGSVVNVSSSAAKTPHAMAAAAYAASKGALNALTRQLALEMAQYGIRVNAVCPGPIQTDMSAQWTDGRSRRLRRHKKP